MIKCRICGNENGNKLFIAKEMMFGTNEEFEYFECAECKTIQIKDIPVDIKKYYPENYSSMSKFNTDKPISILKKFIKMIFAQIYLNKIIGLIFTPFVNKFNLFYLKNLKTAGCNLKSKILDVGSGIGNKLIGLKEFGFTQLYGSDPFIDNEIEYPSGLRIYKRDINGFTEKFDFIMLNHSFEHMFNPKEILQKINSVLNPEGICMIKIPVSQSYAWENYKEYWVALDAPRHIHLLNQKSMHILSGQTGFKIVKTVFDSSEYQFLGSEQYKKGITLLDEKSFYVNPSNTIFTEKEILQYKKKAKKLNKEGKGDTICFYLKKVNPNE